MVTVTVGSQKFAIHEKLLAYHSPFFEAELA